MPQNHKQQNNNSSQNLLIANTLLLNRILQQDNSSSRKTQKKVAAKFSCSVTRIARIERNVMSILRDKVNVLNLLIEQK